MHGRRRSAFLLVLPLLATAGCNDPAIERGRAPPLALGSESRVIDLYGYGAARALATAIADLGAENGANGLRAIVDTDDRREAAAARVRLIDDGIDPAAITVRHDPADRIVLLRIVATQADCAGALRPTYSGDVSNSLDSLGRCTAADDLAASLVDPGDLVRPTQLGPTDGAVAARAVLDWERGDVKQPSTGQNDAAAQAGNGNGGNVSAPAAAPTGVTVGATAPVNPLLAPGL